MWVSLLLFLFYALVCSYLILRMPIIKQSGIAPKVILALFIIKLIGGLCYHYINTVRFYGGDSHGLFLETETYLKRPQLAIPLVIIVIINWIWNITKGL